MQVAEHYREWFLLGKRIAAVLACPALLLAAAGGGYYAYTALKDAPTVVSGTEEGMVVTRKSKVSVPGGVGDVLTSALALPFIYFALVQVRSIPLTLAVICNVLKDALLGSIPFFIGDIIDVFNRSYVLFRANEAKEAGVPMTNYGLAIAAMLGILDDISLPEHPFSAR